MSDEELQDMAAVEHGVTVPPLSRGKRTFFDDDTSSYGNKVTLDGETFYYNALSETGMAYERAWPATTASKLNMTVDEFVNTKVFTDPEKARIFQEESLALWNTVISDALKDWTLPRPCTESAKLKLWPDLKRDISEAIVGFSKFGVSEARFRQSRSTGANSGA